MDICFLKLVVLTRVFSNNFTCLRIVYLHFCINKIYFYSLMMSNLIYPCLWFDGQAKEAASFYCSIFNNSKITSENPMVVMFDLEGQKTMALNGGPMFKINPSISFFVNCSSNDEVDNLWQKLSDGGSALMPLDTYPWSPKYGWVKDKFG